MHKVRIAILLVILAGACALAYFSMHMSSAPRALREVLVKTEIFGDNKMVPAKWEEPVRLHNSGRQQYKDGEYEKAVESFKKVLELVPETEDNIRPDSLIYIGQCFYNLKRYEESVEYLKAFIAATDYPFRGYQWAGMAYWQLGDYDKSLEYTQKALDAAPPVERDRVTIGYAYMNMARTLQDLGRYDEALENINRAIETAPEMRWYSRRAQIQYALGHYEEALAALDQLKEKGHKFYKSNFRLLAKVSVENGMYREAYDVILEHFWKPPEVIAYFDDKLTAEDRCLLAEAAYLSGHEYRAYIELKSIEKYPPEELEKAGTCLVLGMREPAGGTPWRGEKYFETALSGGVSEQRIRYLRGESRMDDRRYVDAAADFRELIKLKPGDAGLHLKLGKALLLAWRARDAAMALEKAAELAPGNAEILKWLGTATMESGEWKEGEAYLEKAAELAPRDPETHFRLGVARARQQEFRSARETLDRAVELAPGSSVYRTWRGAVLFHLDERDAAVRDFEAVMDMGIPRRCTELAAATPCEMIAGPAGTSDNLHYLFSWEIRDANGEKDADLRKALVYTMAGDYIVNPRADSMQGSDNLLYWLEDNSTVNRAPLSRRYGVMLFRTNRENEAKRWLDDAVKREPGDPLNYLWRGINSMYPTWNRDISTAKKDFAAAEKKDPRGALSAYWMGRALLAENRYADAEKKFRAALERGANFPAARAGLLLSQYIQALDGGGYLLLLPEDGYCPMPEPGVCGDMPMGQVMNTADAGWIADNWPDERADHPLKLFFQGMAKVANGDYNGALEKFAHLYVMMHFAGGYSGYTFGLEPDLYAGIIYQAMGREETAMGIYDEVAARNDTYWGRSVPFNLHARVLRGLVFEERGDFKAAAEEYKAAKEIIKDHRWIARKAACVAGEVWDNDLAYYMLQEINWSMSEDEFRNTTCFMSLKGDSRYEETMERMGIGDDEYECVFPHKDN